MEEKRKLYKLLGPDGATYLSETPGALGGNSKGKVYGQLNCSAALNTIRRFPGSYEQVRVSSPMKRQPSQPDTALAVGV